MENSFHQLGKILDRILEQHGLSKRVKEHQAMNVWKEVTGKKIAKISEPLKIIDGKLFVRVSNSSWRNELVLLKPAIKQKINNQVGETVIKDIIFV